MASAQDQRYNAAMFIQPTQPNYYNKTQNSVAPEKQFTQAKYSRDARYPEYAAITADGSIFTDYRPKCEKNIPAGQQYATRQWFQHNAENIIKLSRERQAKATGASFASADTVPPHVAVVKCDTTKCEYYPSYSTSSQIPTGIERADKAPPLFGTFDFAYKSWASAPKQLTTSRFEGGRNTPRGSRDPIKT
jgi:hypothetical protein